MPHIQISDLPEWNPDVDGLNLLLYVVDMDEELHSDRSKKVNLGKLLETANRIANCQFCGQPTIVDRACDYCGAPPKTKDKK